MRQPCDCNASALFYICGKALPQLWKSFLTDVKKLICNGICASQYPILHLEAYYSA